MLTLVQDLEDEYFVIVDFEAKKVHSTWGTIADVFEDFRVNELIDSYPSHSAFHKPVRVILEFENLEDGKQKYPEYFI